jgi:hypothetical protein
MDRTIKRTLILASSIVSLALVAMAPSAALAQAPLRIGGRLADRGNGTLMLVGRNANGTVTFTEKPNPSGSSWPMWYSLGGGVSSEPVTLVNANSKAIVFARGTDDRMYFRQETTAGDAGSFAWWDVIDSGTNPGFRGNPALVRLGDGRLSVFGTANNGALYQSTQATAGGSWSGWTSHGAPGSVTFNGSPVVAVNANGSLSVFVRGSDGAAWVRQQVSGNWVNWASLGGTLQNSDTSIDAIAVDYDANGCLLLAVNNADGTVSVRSQSFPSSTTWKAWANLSPSSRGSSRPALARNYDGTLTLFFWANSNYGLTYITQTAPGATTWSAWFGYSSSAGSSPVAITDWGGLIHVFQLDTSTYLHENLQAGRNSYGYWDMWDTAHQFAGL